MSGGITQLVAVGAQDVHLVGNPQVSLFQSSYKRHTNFAQLTERQVIQGNPVSGGVSTVRLERKGDLVSQVYLTMTDGGEAVEQVLIDWKAQIDQVELLIGGQVIDTIDAEYATKIHPFVSSTSYTKLDWALPGRSTAMYPLRFSFFENLSSAIPLVALQYHDVELRIRWGILPAGYVPECYANFVYLDNEEREMFSSRPRDMLITQVQRMPAPNATRADLNFNHPVKFIASADASAWLGVGEKIKIQVNGVDLSDFKLAKPHFTEAPMFYSVPYGDISKSEGIFLYNWCTNTAQLQPSGSLNFSRIDSARVITSASNISTPIYAVNYNILRIENGLGGLLYSN